jgi:hypothetical protein
MAKSAKSFGLRNLRSLLSVRDLTDILSLVGSLRKMLGQPEQTFERGDRESHVLDETISFVDRLGRFVTRKTGEMGRRGKESAQEAGQEALGGPAVTAIEPAGDRARERIEPERGAVQARQAQDEGGAGIFLIGAILGSLIGAIAALWFAPRSGEETRQEIEQAALDVRRRVEGESIHESIQAGKAEARRYQQLTGGH